MWDAASYYRHYELSYSAIASHCRSWVGPEGAECLVDFRMMFGCRAAANWAQRGTGLIAWLMQRALDRMVPASPVVRRAFQLMYGAGIPSEKLQASCTYHYIDDVPTLTLQSEACHVEQVMAALWKVLGVKPQGKKVWPEGGFETS